MLQDEIEEEQAQKHTQKKGKKKIYDERGDNEQNFTTVAKKMF